MSLLPEVRDRLVATAATRAAQTGAPRPNRLARALVPSVAVLSTAAVVAVIVLTVHTNAGHESRLQPSSPGQALIPPKRTWVNAMSQAEKETSRDRACRSVNAPSVARYRYDIPDSSITTELPALKQPPPPVQRVSPAMLGSRPVLARGVYIRYARRGQMSGVRYYLLPATRINAANPIPARCYAEQRAAFQRWAAHFPHSQRAAAMRYEDDALQTQRALNAPVGVCLLYMSPGLQGQACRSIDALRLRPGTAIGSGGDNHQTITALVVPSSVATVTAHYAAQSEVGHSSQHTSTERPVDNVVIFRIDGGWDPPSLTFRSASGKLLWTSPQKAVAGGLSQSP